MGFDERKNMERKYIENARKYDWGEIVDLVEYFYNAW